jgi:hypothetical protein
MNNLSLILKTVLKVFLCNFVFISLLSASNEPIIVSQPTNITQCLGGHDTLRVLISEKTTVTYQWQKSQDTLNWTSIEGANQASYIPESKNISKTWYRVLVKTANDNAQEVVSKKAEVVIEGKPYVLVSSVNCKENTMTLKAQSLGGTGDCSFQWQISETNSPWTDIKGAIGDEYTAISTSSGKKNYRVIRKCTGSGCCDKK